jgi:phosphoglycerol transferase MdoB-like AlkP superfamily enzyme
MQKRASIALKHPFSLTIFAIVLANAITISGSLVNLSANHITFWLLWGLKSLGVIGTLMIPIMLGIAYDNRRATRSQMLLSGLLSLLLNAFLSIGNQAHTLKYPVDLITNAAVAPTCLSLLLICIPLLQYVVSKFAITTWRVIVIGIFVLLLLSGNVIATNVLAFNAGQSFSWYVYLFIVGYWLANDHWWQALMAKSKRYLIPLTFTVTSFSTWLTTNIVNYDPHHGMTMTLHYLTSIPTTQPLLLIFAVAVLSIPTLQAALKHQFTLQAIWNFSATIIILAHARVISNVLGKWHPANQLIMFLAALIAAFLTILIISRLMSLTTKKLAELPWPTAIKIGQRITKQWPKRPWRFALLLLSIWLMTIISMSALWSWNLQMTQWLILNREAVIWINVLLVTALFGILYALSNHYWFSHTLSLIVYLIWLVANNIKVNERAEPILPSDMSMVGSLKELLGMVNPWLLIGMVIVIIISISSSLILQKCDLTVPHIRPLRRITFLLMAGILLGGFNFANHQHTPISLILHAAGDKPYFYSQLRGSRLNGSLLQFANNVDVTIMPKPHDYSKKAMHALAKRYQNSAQQINVTRQHNNLKKQTVIFNLSESFADPARVPNLKLSRDPIPYIHSLKQKTDSGLMLSSGYGGGTANMEYQSLTGLAINNFSPTLPTPYSQLVPYQKVAPAFTDLFNYKTGIHPFTANLYSRIKVYKKFGFNRFYHLDSKDKLSYTAHIQNSPYISDHAAYKQTLKVMRDHPQGQFINLVTMQNHMPFDNYYQHDNYQVSGNAYHDNTHKREIENYAQGLHYTDQALHKFIRAIDRLNYPVTFVWYGDHLPGLYNGDSMAHYGLKLHETDYFIYSNRYSRKHGYSSTLPKTKIVSPNNFAAMSMEKMNMKVSPYYALLTDVYEKLPAMTVDSFEKVSNNTANASSEYVNQDGKVVSLTHNCRAARYSGIHSSHYFGLKQLCFAGLM